MVVKKNIPSGQLSLFQDSDLDGSPDRLQSAGKEPSAPARRAKPPKAQPAKIEGEDSPKVSPVPNNMTFSGLAETRQAPNPRTIKPKYETKLHREYNEDIKKAYLKLEHAIRDAIDAFYADVAGLPPEGERTPAEHEQYRRALVRAAKLAVRSVENSNRFHLFIFRSAVGKWWKMGGNSVSIYNMMIGSEVNREVRANNDTDKFSIFPDGVISFQSYERLEGDIRYTHADISLDETIDYGVLDGYIRAYRLAVPLTGPEIRKFRDLDKNVSREIYNNIFSAKPELSIWRSVTDITKQCLNFELRMDKAAKSVVAGRFVSDAVVLRRLYLDLINEARTDEARYPFYKEMYKCIGDIMTTLSFYFDANLLQRTAATNLSGSLAKLREQIRQKINKYENRHEIAEKIAVGKMNG